MIRRSVPHALLLALFLGACSKDRSDEPIVAVRDLLRPELVEQGLHALREATPERTIRDWGFDADQGLAQAGWLINENMKLSRRSADGLHFELSQAWPLMHLPEVPAASDFNAVMIRMRSAGGPGHTGAVVWNWTVGERGEKRFDLHGDHQFHDYVVVLGTHPKWGQPLHEFGINPLFVVTSAQRSDITIERIALLELSPATLLGIEGYSSESSGWRVKGETRPSLAMSLGQWKSIRLTPGRGSSLILEGTLPPSLAKEGEGARFEAWVVEDGERHRLFEETLVRTAAHPEPHFEETARLDRWAGDSIEIELRVRHPDGGRPAAHGGLWVEPRQIERGPLREHRQKPRRIVLVTVDTLRADYLPSYGDTITKTPFFDSLARRGARFDVCYSTANATNPSHASILTSLSLQDHGVYDNDTRLSLAPETIATLLAKEGYRTAAIVSAPHLSARHSGLGRGFDIYDAPRPLTPYPQASQTTERALRLLSRTGQEPLFLWVHYFDPHIPYRAPEPYSGQYYDDDPSAPFHPGLGELALEPGWEEHPYWSFLRGVRDPEWLKAQYRSEISYVDSEIARLKARLDRMPGGRNTLFALTSDHGESLGEHGVSYEHFGLHDTVTRVPMFLVGPGVPEGHTVTSPVSTLDIVPTILDMAGLRAPEELRGQSLVPYLAQPDFEADRPIFFEHTHRWQVGVRSNDYKLLHSLVDAECHTEYQFRKDEKELYQLLSDPEELDDLSERHPAFVEIGDRLIRAYRNARHQGLEAGTQQVDPAMAAALRQLGYAK
ncbi:MAG: sulfatase-like hydrolase/transferase [Planctomycetota bacterium]